VAQKRRFASELDRITQKSQRLKSMLLGSTEAELLQSVTVVTKFVCSGQDGRPVAAEA